MATPQYIKDAQNNYNAKFDLVQLKLDKGAKKRIRAIIGENGSITAYCKDAVMTAIESDEDFTQEEPTEPAQEPEQVPETKPEPQQVPIEPVPAVENGDFSKCQTLEEMQAIIDAKNAEKARLAEEKEEQRKAENTAEIMGILEGMRENPDAENGENEGAEFQGSENSGSGDPGNKDCPF